MLRGYWRSWLRGDLIAGVTVAAYLIPQVMAYAVAAGLIPAGHGVCGGGGPASRHGPVGGGGGPGDLCRAGLVPIAVDGTGVVDRAGDGDRDRAAGRGRPGAVRRARRHACPARGADVAGRVAAAAGFRGGPAVAAVLVGYTAGLALIMIAGQLSPVTGRSPGRPSSRRPSRLPAASARAPRPRSRSRRQSWPFSSCCGRGGPMRPARCWPCCWPPRR